MGSSHSRPELNRSQTDLICTDRCLLKIPFKIRKGSKLKNMELSGNQLQELPRNLEHLTTLYLARNQISAFPEKMLKALESYKDLQFLDISGNTISEIPIEFRKLKSLRKLSASNNHLQKLSNINVPLEIADFMQNRFSEVPDFQYDVFLLVLDFNLIEKIDKEIHSLVRLYINMNRICSISPNLIFPNLEVLEISKNRLSTLPNLSTFAPKLKKFDCSLNYLTEFPNFTNEIFEIVLNGNQIAEIPDSIKDLTNLQSLDVSSNNLTHIPELPPSITSLSALCNQITEVAKSTTPKLAKLLLMKNKLTTFPQYEKNIIQELFIMRNLLRDLPAACFSPQITRISAIENKIKSIPVDLFKMLPKLTHLNLTKNKLKNLPEEIKNSNLICLTISENPITEIPGYLPQSLVALYCSYTKIKQLPDQISELPNLETIVSSGNGLDHLPNVPHLKKLILSRNNFEELPENLPNSLLILDMSCNKLECMPKDFSFPALLDADFSHNNIKELSQTYNCVRLKSFKISHNPIIGSIDLQHFPFLDCFDFSFTSVTLNEQVNSDDEIREIITSDSSLFTSPQYKLVTEEHNWVAFSEMRGQRESMEDAIVVRPNLFKGIDLYCVFDGHGGNISSTSSAYKVVKICQQPEAEFSEQFIESIFSQLHHNLKDLQVTDGSTIALALIKDNEILFGHLGDSRALLISESGEIKHVTNDHKPENRDEIDRILDMGGKVSQSRTNGVVAVARCLGDFSILGVGNTPTISRLLIEPDDRWVIVGCDGLFDVLTNQNIGDIAAAATNAQYLAYDLRNIAYNRLCRDNISTVVIDLKNRPKNQSS